MQWTKSATYYVSTNCLLPDGSAAYTMNDLLKKSTNNSEILQQIGQKDNVKSQAADCFC